jgi:dihydrofolate reductase
MRPRVILIAAVSRDGFISRGAGVPWDIPADRAQFRATTANQWLLLGRRTYEEMQGWFLPGHHPLVLSGDASFTPPIGQRVSNAAQAITIATGPLYVCGGSECYAAAMPHADQLLISRVDEALGAGLPFPIVDAGQWRCARSEPQEGFVLETWHRV